MTTRQELQENPNESTWATTLEFVLDLHCGFTDVSEWPLPLPWSHERLLILEPRKLHPDLERRGATAYRLTINAIENEGEAKSLGTKLASALLYVAISKSWGMSLMWPDPELPCRVMDRTPRPGLPAITQQAFAFPDRRLGISEFNALLDGAFAGSDKYLNRRLLSLELCASSNYGSNYGANSHARLVMLVSALEALVPQQKASVELGPMVSELEEIVEQYKIKDEELKDSLLSRIQGLKNESIRRSLRKYLEDAGSDKDDLKLVDSAYKARSKVVHEGKRVADLDSTNGKLLSLLRRLYGIDS